MGGERRETDLGQRGQHRVHGLKHASARLGGRQRLDPVEGHGLFHAEPAHRQAPELGDVRAAAERLADVVRQTANIGALGAGDLDLDPVAREVQQPDRVQGHPARLALDLDAGAGKLVERLALVLEGRIHRRHLLDLALETAQRLLDLAPADGHGTMLRRLALAVIRRRALPETKHRPVALVGVEQELRELGGLAEGERQQAGGDGIEAAGMAGLAGIQQALGNLQRRVRGHASRLVEQQHAIYGIARPSLLLHRFNFPVPQLIKDKF